MLRCCATPSISVRRGWTQVLIGWAGFAIAKPAPQGTETMLIKVWGEKSKKALALHSLRLQLALTQSCDWTEMEKLIKKKKKNMLSTIHFFHNRFDCKTAYLSALKQPSQEFKSCRTKERQTKHIFTFNLVILAKKCYDVISGKEIRRHG